MRRYSIFPFAALWALVAADCGAAGLGSERGLVLRPGTLVRQVQDGRKTQSPVTVVSASSMAGVVPGRSNLEVSRRPLSGLRQVTITRPVTSSTVSSATKSSVIRPAQSAGVGAAGASETLQSQVIHPEAP